MGNNPTKKAKPAKKAKEVVVAPKNPLQEGYDPSKVVEVPGNIMTNLVLVLNEVRDSVLIDNYNEKGERTGVGAPRQYGVLYEVHRLIMSFHQHNIVQGLTMSLEDIKVLEEKMAQEAVVKEPTK